MQLYKRKVISATYVLQFVIIFSLLSGKALETNTTSCRPTTCRFGSLLTYSLLYIIVEARTSRRHSSAKRTHQVGGANSKARVWLLRVWLLKIRLCLLLVFQFGFKRIC